MALKVFRFSAESQKTESEESRGTAALGCSDGWFPSVWLSDTPERNCSSCPIRCSELFKQRLPLFSHAFRQSDQAMERIGQFVGIANVGPGIGADLRDGCGIERSDLVQDCIGQHAAQFDRAGTAFFQ